MSAEVTVIDRVPYTASVTPEQARAYVRRMLPDWKEGAVLGPIDPTPVYFHFTGPGIVRVWVPAQPSRVDYGRRMAELVDELVAMGLAVRPSDVLKAMADVEVST